MRMFSPIRSRRARVLTGLLILVLLMAACGDDDDKGGSDSAPDVTPTATLTPEPAAPDAPADSSGEGAGDVATPSPDDTIRTPEPIAVQPTPGANSTVTPTLRPDQTFSPGEESAPNLELGTPEDTPGEDLLSQQATRIASGEGFDTEATPSLLDPLPLPPEDLRALAGEFAVSDLAQRLDASPDAVEVLDPEQIVSAPDLGCPAVDDPEVALYYVYLQYEAILYPYQYYQPSEPDTEPVIEACNLSPAAADVLTPPEENPVLPVLDAVRGELGARGLPENGTFVKVSRHDWNNDALNCPLPVDVQPTPALISGYKVIYEANDITYEFHTDLLGEQIELCEAPIGFQTMDALLFHLESDNLLPYELTEETVTYNGLDAEGVVIHLMTPTLRRIAAFNFETPTAARIAAEQIDDERVSKIYVAGYVLIVQEAFDPQVYGLLLGYAEEVRSPMDVRLAEGATPEAMGTLEAAPGE